MKEMLEDMVRSIGGFLPNVLGALAILVGGWIVALLAAAIIRAALKRTTLDNRLVRWITGAEADTTVESERWIAKGVFYAIILFTLIAFFQALGLTLITEPLNELLVRLSGFLPQLLGAALLLLVAWVVATVLKRVLTGVLGKMKLDERLGDTAGMEEEDRVPLTKTFANMVYWLVFLLFLPAILGTLGVEGLLEPVNRMVSKALGFLPNILSALVIVVVGWFVARIVQRIASNLLASIGTDRLSEKTGLTSVLGQKRLSDLLGFVIYVLILIPVLVGALNALALDAITAPASNMLGLVLKALPSIFAAALVLVVAYVIGRVLDALVSQLLEGVGFNKIMVHLGLGKEPIEGTKSPSAIAGHLVLVLLMLFAATEAFRLLDFAAVAQLLVQFMTFAGHVILGLVVFGLGLYVANLVSQAIKSSGTAQANLLALVARSAIAFVAGAMALRQMGLADEIINLAFGLLLGAIAVAAAIAFGLGGRDLAARHMSKWIDSAKSDDQKD